MSLPGRALENLLPPTIHRHFLFVPGLILVLVLLTGLAACGDNTAPVPAQSPTPPSTTPVPQNTPTVQINLPTAILPVIQPTTAATSPTALSGTTAPVPPTKPANENLTGLFYARDDTLYFYGRGLATPLKLAAGVRSYIRVGENRLVYFQEVSSTLQLKMLQLTGGTNFKEYTLDGRAFSVMTPPPAPGPVSKFGVDDRALGNLAASPDGTQVAYTRANQAASFQGMGDKEYPTELWLANLDPTNPAPKKLVPNEKDYIIRPTWSTDGNRIAFMRTDVFGTGAGYYTALWSVYKDGTRLAFLTGPDLGTVNGQKYSAIPAYNLRWLGPLLLSFTASNRIATQQWVHDLSAGTDFPRPVALSLEGRNSAYCSQTGRFAFIQISSDGKYNRNGLYTAEVNKTSGLPDPALVDSNGDQVYGCYNDTLLYRDNQGQLSLQQIREDGAAAGKPIRLGNSIGKDKNILAAFSPDGKYIAVFTQTENPNFTVYRANGTQLTVSGTQPQFNGSVIEWSGNQLVALIGYNNTSVVNGKLVAIDLAAASPEIKEIGNTDNGFLNIVTDTYGQN